MQIPAHSQKNPGQLSAGKEPTNGPPIRYGFNPGTVTHYNYNPENNYLIVGFASGEWVRYVGPRAQDIFAAIVDCHWSPRTAKVLESLNEALIVPVWEPQRGGQE